MTTIAYSRSSKQIAVDSRMTNTYNIIESDGIDKTIKNELGLWFFAGSFCDATELARLKHNDKADDADNTPDVSALLIHKGKVYHVITTKRGYCKWELCCCDTTVGSGEDFAKAALDYGATAKEAVEYAMTRDVFTGGKVNVFDVE